MVATEDVEEVEILKARFETFDEEMRANADKVDVVNQLSRQLLQNEHPNAEEVIQREDQLNKKWVLSFLSSATVNSLFSDIIGSTYNIVVTSCIAAQLCIMHDRAVLTVLALAMKYVHIRTISSLLVWHKTSK